MWHVAGNEQRHNSVRIVPCPPFRRSHRSTRGVVLRGISRSPIPRLCGRKPLLHTLPPAVAHREAECLASRGTSPCVIGWRRPRVRPTRQSRHPRIPRSSILAAVGIGGPAGPSPWPIRQSRSQSKNWRAPDCLRTRRPLRKGGMVLISRSAIHRHDLADCPRVMRSAVDVWPTRPRSQSLLGRPRIVLVLRLEVHT